MVKFIGDGKANTSRSVFTTTPWSHRLSSMMLPEPWRLTSLKAHMSMSVFSSSLQMIAVARFGLMVASLSLVVQTFHAARFSCFFFLRKVVFLWFPSVTSDAVALSYGLRIFSSIAIDRGASVTSNAVTIYLALK